MHRTRSFNKNKTKTKFFWSRNWERKRNKSLSLSLSKFSFFVQFFLLNDTICAFGETFFMIYLKEKLQKTEKNTEDVFF